MTSKTSKTFSESRGTSPRTLAGRVLGSRVLDLLAGPHGVDGYLEQIRPTWSVREPRAEVVEVDRSTPDAVTLRLRTNAAWQGFRAGQFVNATVDIDGAKKTRCYSPASIAGPGRELELTVRAHPEGLVSNHLLERAHPGMIVGLSQAEGDFHLPDQRPGRIVLISAGSGITPVMSMLRTLCAEGHKGPVEFIHYARDRDQAIYADELERIAAAHPNLSLARSYTRDAGAGELDGHFDESHVAVREGAETFACGPAELLDEISRSWDAAGLAEHLHTESFTPPALAAAEPGSVGGAIRLTQSGLELTDTGEPLLAQAEAAGLNPLHGCRMGICHSCSCTKTEGVVRNLVTGEVSGPEPGLIQICVSAPVGDVAIEL